MAPTRAGKSSALRAIRDFASSAFPRKTPDSHPAPPGTLAPGLSAVIERGGEELAFCSSQEAQRLAGRPSTTSPLEEGRALARFMKRSSTAASFERLFRPRLRAAQRRRGRRDASTAKATWARRCSTPGASGRSVHRVKLAAGQRGRGAVFKDRGQKSQAQSLCLAGVHGAQAGAPKTGIHSPEKYAETTAARGAKKAGARPRRARAELGKAAPPEKKIHAAATEKTWLSPRRARARTGKSRRAGNRWASCPACRRGTGERARTAAGGGCSSSSADLRRLTHKARRGAGSAFLPCPSRDRWWRCRPSRPGRAAHRASAPAKKLELATCPSARAKARTVRDADSCPSCRALGLGDDSGARCSAPPRCLLAQRERGSPGLGQRRMARLEREARKPPSASWPDAKARVEALTSILKQAHAAARSARA